VLAARRRGDRKAQPMFDRLTSTVRSATKTFLDRVKSRNCRMSSGGTNDARTSPWAARAANHSASETSFLRPGIARTSEAFTN
jgi:hypothetical protein